ncbi:glutamine--fructose-6-phosphate transaminase (isomerizing) [Candidatus Daviesbacteria bacterium]|nr:glutamine--fructose-6-phosphate transaminase (isomerizing) [Candidatus Daviesbacteria bacterium]
MCGIFGLVGSDKNAASVVLEGLKCLEYRGYDSWGVGVASNGQIKIDKHSGKIGNSLLNLPEGSFAFGHTRWATHGKVTDINAHPHLDCSGKISVVHNGIIENYQQLKLELKNHRSISETDTEIFAHIVEDLRKKHSLKEAVRLGFLKLKGLSAFLVAEADSETLIAVKNGSPLVIGLGDKENLVASDAHSLIPLTRKIIFLEDGQLAEITKNKVRIFDVQTGRELELKIEEVTFKAIEAEKEDYPHFMLKEISEEPKVLENILLNLKESIIKFTDSLKNHSKVYLVASGSAYFAALAGSYFFSKIAEKELIPVAGSEFIYKEKFLDKNSLVVFLSQSGETIDIIEPLKKIKEKGIQTAALVNVFGSTLYRLVDEKIWLEAGPEIAVVSTKAMIAKLAVLGLSAFSFNSKYEAGEKLLSQTISNMKDILKQNLDEVVNFLHDKEHIYVIGRGISYPVSLEAALKLKEACYIHTEGFSGGELKHGAIALVDKGTPCIIFAPKDESFDSVISNAMEIKARGGIIIGLSEERNEVFDHFIEVKESGDLTAINNILISQLLAYKIAIKKGLDPDKPRNLAKSVTVK